MNFFLSKASLFSKSLLDLPNNKILISTINAHSYNVAQKDNLFAEALKRSDILLPDGISIVLACQILNNQRLHKIAGADLFLYEMNRLNKIEGTCFFLGSNNKTLNLIHRRAEIEFPKVKVFKYSPPYKSVFSSQDNKAMLEKINANNPDVLFIGLTAPKQEKWAYQHLKDLKTGHVCCIGAVFDFYAGTVRRAPEWLIDTGLEWLYRLIRQPIRMWRRYLIGNIKFIWLVIKEYNSKQLINNRNN